MLQYHLGIKKQQDNRKQVSTTESTTESKTVSYHSDRKEISNQMHSSEFQKYSQNTLLQSKHRAIAPPCPPQRVRPLERLGPAQISLPKGINLNFRFPHSAAHIGIFYLQPCGKITVLIGILSGWIYCWSENPELEKLQSIEWVLYYWMSDSELKINRFSGNSDVTFSYTTGSSTVLLYPTSYTLVVSTTGVN